MKKVPTATCALSNRYIVSIEWVYTPSTFNMKSVVYKEIIIKKKTIGTWQKSYSGWAYFFYEI